MKKIKQFEKDLTFHLFPKILHDNKYFHINNFEKKKNPFDRNSSAKLSTYTKFRIINKQKNRTISSAKYNIPHWLSPLFELPKRIPTIGKFSSTGG